MSGACSHRGAFAALGIMAERQACHFEDRDRIWVSGLVAGRATGLVYSGFCALQLELYPHRR